MALSNYCLGFFEYEYSGLPYLHSFPTRRSSDLGPVILVETGRVLQTFGVDIQHEALAVNIQRQRGPRNREQPASEAQETRSEEHTSELQSRPHLVCRLLHEKKNPYL